MAELEDQQRLLLALSSAVQQAAASGPRPPDPAPPAAREGEGGREGGADVALLGRQLEAALARIEEVEGRLAARGGGAAGVEGRAVAALEERVQVPSHCHSSPLDCSISSVRGSVRFLTG